MAKKLANSLPSKTQCESAAAVLKTLAHPQRLMILCQLVDGPKTVSELEGLSGATQSAVSQFLGRMKAEGLVNAERDGNFVVYDIKDPRIKHLIFSMNKVFC